MKKLIVSTPASGIATRLHSSPHAVSHASEVNSGITSCPDVEPTPKKRGAKTTEITSGTTSAPSVTTGTAGPVTGFPVGPCMLRSINQAIERQGQSKNSWKKEEIEMQKGIKEKELLLQ
jgi:hypothetical protein